VFIFTLEGGPSKLRLGRVLLGCIHAPNRYRPCPVLYLWSTKFATAEKPSRRWSFERERLPQAAEKLDVAFDFGWRSAFSAAVRSIVLNPALAAEVEVDSSERVFPQPLPAVP
jgi:hypothetical protein